MTGITQRIRIGHHAFIGGFVKLEEDVIPFALVRGEHGYLDGVNIIGMQRHNYAEADIAAVRKAYRQIFSDGGTFAERVESAAAEYSAVPAVMDMIAFIRNRDKALCQPKTPTRAAA
jgi:UDP-N-acetylglucosamine acyltransferase